MTPSRGRLSIPFITRTWRFPWWADRTPSCTACASKQKALQSGIVFTEIDHNYVDPMTAKYRDVVPAPTPCSASTYKFLAGTRVR